MFGVLVVVLGCDPIAGLELGLRQRQVMVIASSRIVRVPRLRAGRTRSPRGPALRAACKRPWRSLLTRIPVGLSAVLHAHSLIWHMKRSVLHARARRKQSLSMRIVRRRTVEPRGPRGAFSTRRTRLLAADPPGQRIVLDNAPRKKCSQRWELVESCRFAPTYALHI
jgi:hypothetical protein